MPSASDMRLVGLKALSSRKDGKETGLCFKNNRWMMSIHKEGFT